ncbi:MAG: kelch repeat-containing protein [Planctomycetota bacterium]|nr:kelch repeat-containing protein [Planctomycetota bacterium]
MPDGSFGRQAAKAAAMALAAVFCGAGEQESGGAGAGGGAAALKDAPPNIWVKVHESKTGRRRQPLFVYAANIKRFVLATGLQATGGVVPRHYDTEEFDPVSCRWFNAYPRSVAAGRPESGPVGEDYARAREKQGYNGPELFYKDGEHLRLGAGGQWLGTATTYDWCYVPDDGKVYLSMWGKTLRYDPVARTWEDLNSKPRGTCPVWGSMCYDPINKEILHSGGGGGSAEVGTWVYSIEKNEWRRLEFGSPKLKEIFAKARDLKWRAKALLGACCNRFAVTETVAEARADLAAAAAGLASAAERLAGEIEAAGLERHEKAAGEMGARRLRAAAAAVRAAGPALAGRITPEKIAAVRTARVVFEQAVDALAPEPPGRARSQTAFDPVNGKIVLFGGDGLDRTLSDTWVYDCASRTWEQRFPAKCPAPRAGHILAWLPKSKRIVLAGGYSRTPLPQEIWTCDVAANRWDILFAGPESGSKGGGRSAGDLPSVTARETQVGAVSGDDVLVCTVGSAVTWACKVDPSKADPALAAARGCDPGTYAFNTIDPAKWESAASPDPEGMARKLRELPVNRWTSLKFPLYAPGATNRWGTTAYDTDRHQLLFWGGGHATSHENDVAHFGLLGGFWTIGYHPDDPIEIVYASQPVPLSFNDRCHVPIHAYKAYCYDPTAGKMFYFDRAYNPAVREWEPAPFPGVEHRGPMHSHMESTPKGAVVYSEKGLFRFDAASGAWKKLPWDGPKFGAIWCDGHSLCYDSKRDCLWLASDKAIFRYEMATGKAEKADVKKPAALGQFFFWGEEVYLPEADLILLMQLFKKPDGTPSNAAFDPSSGKFFWVDLKFAEEDGKPVSFKDNPFSWHDALAYDPELKLVVLNNSSARKVWVLRFERKTAALAEMTE